MRGAPLRIRPFCDYDRVALKIFGAAGDVEVPAAFRDAVIEKYKRLEEADNV